VQLHVRDAAALLRVSTKTIYRWVADGKVPAYRLNNTLRFDRAELLEWASANRIGADPRGVPEPAAPEGVTGFADALAAGGVHYRVDGDSRDAVLANAASLMRLDDERERDVLLEALLLREDLASTSIGDGFALPHLRNPLRFHLARASVTLCFLERPVPWGAPDGVPVHTLLIVVGPTVRAVLRTHSRAYFALRHPGFRAAVVEQASREVIARASRDVDLGAAP
jgi:PTS system nitrogen regulatory IIA component